MQEAPRSRLAAALRIWMDVGLALVALAVVGLVVWLAISPFQMRQPGTVGDGAVWVGIGTSSIIPIHRLELSPTAGAPALTDPTLVKARGELRFHTRRFDLMLLSFLPMLLVAGAVLAGGWQLRQVLASVARGEPFVHTNPRRIATIGWIILLLAVLQPLLAYVPAAVVLRAAAIEEGIALSPTLLLDGSTVLVGLLVLVLALVFREGARLHQEQSLTV